jgi:hypothetical protein
MVNGTEEYRSLARTFMENQIAYSGIDFTPITRPTGLVTDRKTFYSPPVESYSNRFGYDPKEARIHIPNYSSCETARSNLGGGGLGGGSSGSIRI